jgi:hypothetical protein
MKRLCRLMCGKAKPGYALPALRDLVWIFLKVARLSLATSRKKVFLTATESRRLSAHQAAKPQANHPAA